ncbi:MAG: hypothetical protein IPM29_06155 [Planctomycetes bacterium]|nr:hypothetical protein [Planctomycetota bacterium]
MNRTVRSGRAARIPRVALAISCALAAFAGPAPAQAPRIAPGPVEIAVRWADDGAPVAGAWLTIGARRTATGRDGRAVFDGVPAGRFALVAEHVDGDVVRRDIELPPGRREPLAIAMPRTVRIASCAGDVVLADTGQPVAGAVLELTPVDVPASCRGVLRASSDWQGRVVLRDVPVGRWRAQVVRAGCEPLAAELALDATATPWRLALQRSVERAALRVAVRDAFGGAPITGARVELAGAWPLAPIAAAATDASGGARFADVAVGLLDACAPDGALPVAHRRATLRVAHEGFAPTVVPVTLATDASVEIALEPVAPRSEREPNDALERAEPLPAGAPVQLTFATRDDRDVFLVEVPDPARLRIEVGPDNPCQVEILLLDARGELVARNAAYAGGTVRIEHGVHAGRHYVAVQEWGRDEACETPLRLTVTRDAAPDPFEPNDARAFARRLRAGEHVRGAILPRGDVDCFRLAVEVAGTVRLEIPAHALQRELRVFDAAGERIGTAAAHGGTPLALDVPVQPGELFVELHEWGDDAESTEPYELRCEFAPGDATFDPVPGRDPLGGARRLGLRELVAERIENRGDRDLFQVPVDSAGRLSVRARGSCQLAVAAIDARGRRLAGGAAHAEQPLGFHCEVAGPGVVYVDVREWGDDDWSPWPYTLQTWWEPADDNERLGRDDSLETATPIEPDDVLRGSIAPLGDVDHYRLDLDHAGHVEVRGRGPTQLTVAILDANGGRLAEASSHAMQELRTGADVPAGPVFVRVHEWGGDDAFGGSYELRTEVQRAEPEEFARFGDEPVRPLRVGEARSFCIDRIRDRDRFAVDVTEAGDVDFTVLAPFQVEWQVFDDRSGERVLTATQHGDQLQTRTLRASGPTRYRIELCEWGNDARSGQPGLLLVDAARRPLVAERLGATQPDPSDPTRIAFQRLPWRPGAALAAVTAGVDVDGDGSVDLTLPDSSPVEWRFAQEGDRLAYGVWQGAGGQSTRTASWVAARGPHERVGVRALVQEPAEGAEIDADTPCVVRAISYTGAPIREVRLEVDGRTVASAASGPFELSVPWRELATGAHELRAVARDARGEEGVAVRRVSVSDYFELRPADGAVVSGDSVTVAWRGHAFGDARVRVRARGETDWREVVGQRGRERAVLLAGLDPGRVYEYQPLGGAAPGPVRAVTRVKGLAFGRAVYGAHIERAYDQRVPIAVRNHAETSRVVRLRCGAPASELLLCGFVGEGSEGAPVELGPGEEREFLLGISAQDVVRAEHAFAIFVDAVDGDGEADEARVELVVALPTVDLQWNDLGPTSDGLGRRFELVNAGSPLTDLRIRAAGPDLLVAPSVEHGMIERGERREVVVRPRLFEGFTSAQGAIVAGALAEDREQAVEIALAEGDRLQLVSIAPEPDPDDPFDDELLHAARTLSAFWLDPGAVDWSRRHDPEDVDGDGRPDRWHLRDELEGIEWVADDGDGDGELDFVRADVWFDGRFDFAAFRGADGGWERTNLVDSWLEMGFALPWSRDAYERHDVDLVLNGQVIGRLRDQIPEGGYVFPVPPAALRFAANGRAEEQEVEIRSTHLRGGHYVVSSDFALRTRMTGARVWAAGPTPAEARERALAGEDVALAVPDFAVSSAELRLQAPERPRRGDEIELTVPLRNLGAAATHDVAVALIAGEGDAAVELARQYVEDVPLVGSRDVRFRWRAGAGQQVLRVVVDPDGELDDWSATNDEARIALAVAGDDAPPSLELAGLDPGARLDDTRFDLGVTAGDDGGIARVEARVDGGLWRPLAGVGGERRLRGLLQPGEHAIAVRAIDGGGNVTVRELAVRVDAPVPVAELVEPADGAEIDADHARVALRTGPDAQLAALRVDGGPWIRAPIRNGVATGEVPVGFGAHDIEAAVVDGRGARSSVRRRVQGTAQPVEGADGFRPDWLDADAMRLPFEDTPDFGPVDVLDDPDLLFVPPARPRAGAVQRAPETASPPAPAAAPRPLPTAGPAPRRPAGGLVAARQRQSSQYCTNRPHIRVPFRLPDWLQRLELPPPGSAEFELMIERLLGRLRAQGVDTSRLERFQEFLERRSLQMEDLRELPGWLESLGLARPPTGDPEALRRYREQMLDKTRAWWLRLLASGDPALIEQGLRARMEAFRGYDEGLAENAQAAIDSILAHQTLVEDLVEGLPAVGEALDLYAVITGERLLNGQEISALERAIRAGGLLAPKVLEEIFKRSTLAQRAAVALSDRLTTAGRWGRQTLSNLTNIPTRDIDAFLTRVQRALTTEISLDKWRLNRQAEVARRALDATADGAADLARHADDLADAQRLIRQLDDVADDEAFERLVIDSFQTNKTAQRVVNSDAATDALRARINQSMRRVYDDIDQAAVDRLNRVLRASDDELGELAEAMGRSTDDLRRFRDNMHDLARRQGVDPGDLRVRSQDFSGIDPNHPGRSVGRDRDVTFAVEGPGGRRIDDVHHSLSQPVYEQELWRRTRGGPLPDAAAIRANADALDQMVTSRWHPEAYASGETGFRAFLNGTGTVTRVEDVVDTIAVKSEHWWHLAAREADPTRAAQQVAEGMRQATKQWDRIIEPRLAQYTRNSALAAQIRVPADLQVGLDIFRRVESGAITPRQADAMLQAIGTTRDRVLNGMTGFFESMEKGVGREFRRIGAAQLDDVLAKSPLARGTTEWADAAIDQINDALRTGHVSEQVFLSRRADVLSAVQQQLGDLASRQGRPGAFSALESWIGRALTDQRISRLEARTLREWLARERDGE